MNQDFVLSLTPAIARRLIRIRRNIGKIVLPEELTSLAQKDKITVKDFDGFVSPYNIVRYQITQFLLDCNLRGIVQKAIHPQFDELALMNTARLGKVELITIISPNPHLWNNAARAFFLSEITKLFNSISKEEIEARRHGVLIIDFQIHEITSNNGLNLRALASQFAKTIIFDRTAVNSPATPILVPWPLLAHILFPTMPTALLPRIIEDTPKEYDKPLYMFAPLYNMCIFPELIEDDTIKEQLSDEKLRLELQRYRVSQYS